MSQFFSIHPQNPQDRLIKQAVDVIRNGGIIAYPTDSAYALGCHIGDKAALERMKIIRQLGPKHRFTLVCCDVAEAAIYTQIDNRAYRLLKHCTPGPYTFLLGATREVPRRLVNAKRKVVGIRIPDNPIALALLHELGEPIMSTTLTLPGEDLPMIEPEDMLDALDHQVDLVIDGGNCGVEPTTVVDLTAGEPVVIREGKGDTLAL